MPNDPNQVPRPIAVALKYEAGSVPRVVASGSGSVASTIIQTARDNGIAIEEDPVLASALATVDLDTEIPLALFEAVAEVISFVLAAEPLRRTP